MPKLDDARAPAVPPAPPVRELPVAVGQLLQATVAAIDGDTVWLGWRGAVFEARTQQRLEAGRSYDFVVTATEPHIVLGAAQLPAGAPAAPPPLPGRSGAELLAMLLDAMPRPRDVPLGAELPGQQFARALAAFATGKATAADLQALQRGLGHDQEARVLRLPQLPAEAQPAELASLRTTRKAAALAVLASERDRPATDALAKAQALVHGLNGVERDNARRAEHGLPQWLPLPAAPDLGLLDARLFLLAPEAGGDGAAAIASEGDTFRIVLLLELTQLGPLRVDVAVRSNRVDASFTAVQPAAVASLLRGLDRLRAALSAAGLEPGRLGVQASRTAALPVADLELPPLDGSAMVDCRA